MKNDNIHGYKIRQAICFDNDRGFAIAHNPKAVQPWVCWQFTNDNNVRDYYWGKYSTSQQSATDSFNKRVDEYKETYPSLSVKYNYLAAAEMSCENNYNQIDGIPNNGYKPSIIEQLKQYQHKSADSEAPVSDKPAKSNGAER